MREFTLAVPDAELAELRERLVRTRWPEPLPDAGWDYGAAVAVVHELCEYWRTAYDWRAAEARLNALPQFRHEVAVDDAAALDLHLVHLRSPEPHAVPLLLVHGWPGSLWEFVDVLGPLTDPRAHGGDPADAVHVIAPALPGFGWSAAPRERGWGVDRTARAFARLLADLGYDRYVAQGGDWGGYVTSHLAAIDPEHCAGLHVNQTFVRLGDPADDDPDAAELRAVAAHDARRDAREGGYAHVQATKPDSQTRAQTDSPAGLAAWVIEKFRTWGDTHGELASAFDRDDLLTNLMFYWLPGSTASAARIYHEFRHDRAAREAPPVHVPTAVAAFPAEPFATPRAVVERRYRNLVRWTEQPRGGHFAALEQPELFVADVQGFLAQLRGGRPPVT